MFEHAQNWLKALDRVLCASLTDFPRTIIIIMTNLCLQQLNFRIQRIERELEEHARFGNSSKQSLS